MIHPLRHRSLKIVATLAIAFVAVSVSSCGHTQAASPAVPTETIMKTVRDYGRGHQAAISPAPASVPQETDEQYAGSINNLFVHENFAELEKIEQRNRIEKGRVAGGIWKSSSFFTAIALPRGEEIKDSDYDFRLSIAKKWVAAYPGSATARVALADIYTAYADSARGTGHADSVSDANWKLFYSRVAQAKQVLLEAAAMKDKDAHWFDVMMQVSNGEGWDPPRSANCSIKPSRSSLLTTISTVGTRITFCLSGMASPVTCRLSAKRLPRTVRSRKAPYSISRSWAL